MSKIRKKDAVVRYEALQSRLDSLVASLVATQDLEEPLKAYFDRINSDPEVMLVYREMQRLEKMLPINRRKPANPR